MTLTTTVVERQQFEFDQTEQQEVEDLVHQLPEKEQGRTVCFDKALLAPGCRSPAPPPPHCSGAADRCIHSASE